MSQRILRLLPFLVGGAVLLPGCKDREIATYRIQKEKTPPAALPAASMGASGELPAGHPPIGAATPAPASGPAAPVSPAAENPLTWTAPADWKARAGSAMRRGSYDVPLAGGATADLSISAFGGMAGGLVGNINRWRGQVGLAPLPDDQVTATTESVAANGLKFTVVDLAGQAGGAPVRMLGAIAEFGNETWFFKLTGPDAGVAGVKPAFLEFLRTVKAR
jgi:hypothetical protein